MTSRDFVIWLKGFATAANAYNITPKQWEDVKEILDTVSDSEDLYPTNASYLDATFSDTFPEYFSGSYSGTVTQGSNFVWTSTVTAPVEEEDKEKKLLHD